MQSCYFFECILYVVLRNHIFYLIAARKNSSSWFQYIFSHLVNGPYLMLVIYRYTFSLMESQAIFVKNTKRTHTWIYWKSWCVLSQLDLTKYWDGRKVWMCIYGNMCFCNSWEGGGSYECFCFSWRSKVLNVCIRTG